MCTYSRQAKPFVAKTNLRVLKYLVKTPRGYLTPYQDTPVKLGEMMKPEGPLQCKSEYFQTNSLHGGVIHSTLTTAMNRCGNCIHVTIIPEGTKYWIGDNGIDICSEALIVTEETVEKQEYMLPEIAEDILSNASVENIGMEYDGDILVGVTPDGKPLYANPKIFTGCIDREYNGVIDTTFPYPNTALQDFDGVSHTKKMKELSGERYELLPILKEAGDKYYVPALGEFWQLAINLPFINARFALDKKEPPFPFDWYWTSTECFSYRAWGVYLNCRYPDEDLDLKGYRCRVVLFAIH